MGGATPVLLKVLLFIKVGVATLKTLQRPILFKFQIALYQGFPMMYHLFQNSIWKVVKIAKTYDITLVGDAYFLPPLQDNKTKTKQIGYKNSLNFTGFTIKQHNCHKANVNGNLVFETILKLLLKRLESYPLRE